MTTRLAESARKGKITLANLAAITTGFLCDCTLADTFTIFDGDVTALKEAITFANANGKDDTIDLAPNGTYTLVSVDNSTNGPNGLPVIGADGGNSLTIAGHGATIQRDPSFFTPNFRVLQIGPGADVTLDDLTIAHALASEPPSLGGGILNDHGTLSVTNCIFTQNQAGFGGAIGNSADGGSTSMSITNSTFRENSAGGEGGGIYHSGTGGTATLTITSCSFFLNRGSGGGGGIINHGGSGSATLNVTRSTFNLNSASGIFNLGIAVITNSTFSQNSAGFPQTTGLAIFNIGQFGSASLEIGSNILQVDSGTTLANDSGVVTSLGYNLSNDDGGGFLTALGDQINKDPTLDPAGLQNNGGPTETIALASGSPAIDKGKDFTGTGLDQRGSVRPFDLAIPNAAGGDGSDIGAVEMKDTEFDEDRDGVPDLEDDCSNSDLNEPVFVGTCDTGVSNHLFENGCTMADLIAKAAAQARNHGAFVAGVARLTNDWLRQGIITVAQKAAIDRCAGRSNIP